MVIQRVDRTNPRDPILPAQAFSEVPILPIMHVMRCRLRSVIVASGAALLTIGAGVAEADTVAINGGDLSGPWH